MVVFRPGFSLGRNRYRCSGSYQEGDGQTDLDEKNIGAGLGKGNGHGLTNASRGSCDESSVALEGEHVLDASG